MIGTCIPAGVFPDDRMRATVSGYLSGSRSLYLSSKFRGWLPE
jgi:hypothetical protein